MLPAPSTHDVFLDLEGDRLALEGGREYLFGYVTSANDRYVGLWAATPAEEKAAFEAVVDFILATFAEHPDMHVYHFGAYEPTAFKRLAGRYATREVALDKILRAELFVDLHTIVRHSLEASVESYSIKELEQFFGLAREQDLRAATAHAARDRVGDRDARRYARTPSSCRTRRGRRALQPRGLRLRAASSTLARALRAEAEWIDDVRSTRPELKSGEASDEDRGDRRGDAARDGAAPRRRALSMPKRARRSSRRAGSRRICSSGTAASSGQPRGNTSV